MVHSRILLLRNVDCNKAIRYHRTYLFCLEKLSHLIEAHVRTKFWKPVKASRSSPPISHFFRIQRDRSSQQEKINKGKRFRRSFPIIIVGPKGQGQARIGPSNRVSPHSLLWHLFRKVLSEDFEAGVGGQFDERVYKVNIS